MSAKKNALGKGLGALISDLPLDFPGSNDGVVQIELEKIITNPDQPRKYFSEDSLEELASSIKQHGLIQPIVVTQNTDGLYCIVVGERRFRAAQKAKLKTIPTIVKELQKEELLTLALLENIQREDLNALETAMAYKEIMERLKLTQEELSHLVDKSRSSVANTLRLLRLPQDIQKDILEGRMSEGHGRALVSLGDEQSQRDFRDHILQEHLSVREVEEKVQQNRKKVVPTGQVGDLSSPRKNQKYEETIKNISRILNLKVKVKLESERKGKLELYFSSPEEFESIQHILTSGRGNSRDS